MTYHLLNESKHLDLLEWIDTLEELGVDIAETLPGVTAMNDRADQILSAAARNANAQPAMNPAVQRLALHDDLDDETAIAATADHIAYAQNAEHRERVSEFYLRAADVAHGEAIRRFKRADILGALRPQFDTVTARIAAAAATIPTGVRTLEDAARVGHSDDYLQLERDSTWWNDLASLIRILVSEGIIGDGKPRQPIEFMVEDYPAYAIASEGGTRLRKARGIVAGRPNLHTPTGPELHLLGDSELGRAARRARLEDDAARVDLGLVSR